MNSTSLSPIKQISSSKTLGIVSPIEDDRKDEAGLAKDQIEQSRQRLVKLEEDGLEFVRIDDSIHLILT